VPVYGRLTATGCRPGKARAATPTATLAPRSRRRCFRADTSVRLDDESAADAEALARAEGKSLNETVKLALSEAVERRRRDPKFNERVQRIIDQDRELLERLAK